MKAEDDRRRTYRRTEDIYRKSVETIRDYAIFLTDPDGLVTNWNRGAQHILGYTEAEIIGKHARKFFTAEDRAKDVPQKEMTTAAATGSAEDERWHVRSDGSRFWASGVMTAVRDDGGNLMGFSKVMRDMTHRRRDKKAAKKFFRKLLKGLRYVPSVIITDKLRSYNAAKADVLSSVEQHQQKYRNNRAENSYRPTRLRERVMRRFKSSGHAQRFLSAFGIISSHFRLGRHRYSASSYRAVMKSRFAVWDKAICEKAIAI